MLSCGQRRYRKSKSKQQPSCLVDHNGTASVPLFLMSCSELCSKTDEIGLRFEVTTTSVRQTVVRLDPNFARASNRPQQRKES